VIHVGGEDAGGSWAALAPDLTPLLDVLFILLVFFILTANSVRHALDIDLPREGAEQARPVTEQQPIVVGLHPGADSWEINGRRLNEWTIVQEAIRAAHRRAPEAPIVVGAARAAEVERLLQLLAFLQAEGLSAAQILMQPGAP
jgi:biopolymer transport protein ExbD